MKVRHLVIDREEYNRSFRIIPISDIHLGNRLCAKKHLADVINKYKDDRDALFIFVGDTFDGIYVGDKRYKASMLDRDHVGDDSPIDLAIQDAAKILSPIRDRIIMYLDGNHELTVMDRAGTDMTARLLNTLYCRDKDGVKKADELRYGYAGFLCIQWRYLKKKFSTVIYGCHGVGSAGKTEGGFMTSIGNNAKSYRADIQVYGHNHRLGGWDNIVIQPSHSRKAIEAKKEIRINSGTFLKGLSDDHHTSYSEKAQYRPNELGHMVIEVSFSREGTPDFRYWKETFV